MAIVSKLDSSGNFSISNTGILDEVTIPANSYSVSFNGTSQYLIAPSNAAFAFPGDFTFEGWFYKLTAWTNTMDLVQGNGTGGISFYSAASTLRSGPNNISSYSLGSSTGIPTNAWVHIAFVRKSNSARIYVNGVPLAAAVSDTNSYSQTALYIGGGVDGYFDGYMSNVRVVKGTAIYDPTLSSFTPPTTPLTAIAGTSLLTCQNATIVDNSTNALTITNNGTATTTNTTIPTFARSSLGSDGTLKVFGSFDEVTLNPISAGLAIKQYLNGDYFIAGIFDEITGIIISNYSIYFNSSSYLLFSGNATTVIGTSSFTIEGWYYFTALPTGSQGDFSENCVLDGAYGQPGFNFSSTGVYFFPAALSVILNITYAFTTSTWYHVAWVRNGTTLTCYINGTATGSTATTSYSFGQFNDASIGRNRYGDFQYFNGYISNLRITKSAVYTGNFNVPNSPLGTTQSTATNIAAISDPNSVILLTAKSATIIDSSPLATTITTGAGTPTVSSTIKPF